MFLFNNALNTFNLWSFDINHMVKNHRDDERGKPFFPIYTARNLLYVPSIQWLPEYGGLMPKGVDIY